MMTYEQIIQKGLSKGLEEIEVYVQTSVNNVVKVFDGELSNYNSSEIFGMSIRGLYNGKMCYVYTESAEEDSIDQVLDQLIMNAKSITSTEEEHVFTSGSVYQEVRELTSDSDHYPLTDKIQMLKDMSSEALSVSEKIVKIGYCQYQETAKQVKIINSKGLNLSRNYAYMVTFLGAVATDGKNTTVGFASDAHTSFKGLETKRIVKESTESALGSLGAGSVVSGEYPVVFNKDVTTEILQAFSSIFSGESALRKLTILTDKVGTDVFGKNINIVDDPFCEFALVNYSFDDEGVPCKKKDIVKDGKFLGFFHSLKTAAALNTEYTGNGFKPSVAGSVVPSPTNLYLAPGKHTEEELIASIDNGIYVTEVGGLHAGLNPISGSFNVQASGYMIENGKKTKPVTLFVISGNFYEMMNNVDMIANNIDKRMTDVAAPSIKVNKLIISGK